MFFCLDFTSDLVLETINSMLSPDFIFIFDSYSPQLNWILNFELTFLQNLQEFNLVFARNWAHSMELIRSLIGIAPRLILRMYATLRSLCSYDNRKKD